MTDTPSRPRSTKAQIVTAIGVASLVLFLGWHRYADGKTQDCYLVSQQATLASVAVTSRWSRESGCEILVRTGIDGESVWVSQSLFESVYVRTNPTP